MPTPFARTLRSLDADRPRRPLIRVAFGAAVAGWVAWFVAGSVTLYETSAAARLEVAAAVMPVAAEVAGRVESVELALGRIVEAGTVLVVLDATPERLAADQGRARRDGLASRLYALRREIQAERDALPGQQKARLAAVAEALAQVAEAQTRATYAAQAVARLQPLKSRTVIAEEDYERARAEADARKTTVESLARAADRLEQDRLTQERERSVRLAKLDGTTAELAADESVEAANIRRLDHEVARRTIRAPAAGRIGSAAELRPGAVVRAGDALATLVPNGGIRAVAHFPTATGGRLHVGQSARLRLDAFPWTVYGTLPATVTAVAEEPSGGRLRVELMLATDFNRPVPTDHGYSGSAEVAVEAVSPLRLALRAAGQWLAARRNGGEP